MTDTLKLTHPMMHGPAVKRLQEFCDLLGHDYGPNDGIFGHDTQRAVFATQSELGLERDGICGPVTWRAIIKAVDLLDDDEDDIIIEDGVFDRRGKHPHPKWYARKRSWLDIDGVVIHQTGCKMPLKPTGWDRLNAHIGVTREGLVILANDFTDMIWHAQKLSYNTIGIEIAGNFPGIAGNMRTLWKGGGGPHSLTDGQLEGLDKVLRLLKAEFSKHNTNFKFVHSHRQSAKSRTADPGSEIYENIVMPWMAHLDASDGGSGFKVGKGHTVPKCWNPSYKGNY